MRPNWFFAFPLPGDFVTHLPRLPPNFRRYHPEDVHLTLAFLGACGSQAATAALAVLDERLGRAPLGPIPVSLGDVVPMGPKRAYSNLSALLLEGRESAAAYLRSLENPLLEAAGGRSSRREPIPHVSLARVRRRATEAQRRAGLAWARDLDLGSVTATLDRIALYTWSDDRKERLFQVVEERSLS